MTTRSRIPGISVPDGINVPPGYTNHNMELFGKVLRITTSKDDGKKSMCQILQRTPKMEPETIIGETKDQTLKRGDEGTHNQGGDSIAENGFLGNSTSIALKQVEQVVGKEQYCTLQIRRERGLLF